MYNLETLGSYMLVAAMRFPLVAAMRFPLVRCLVVVLSLALANGNAHAALHSGPAHSEPCPEEHVDHGGRPSPHHQHQHEKGFACCCDCLGCSSAAYLPPGLSTTPVRFESQILYDEFVASLSGRALLPEPDPPRPSTLS
jgi:hypothetical protein